MPSMSTFKLVSLAICMFALGWVGREFLGDATANSGFSLQSQFTLRTVPPKLMKNQKLYENGSLVIGGEATLAPQKTPPPIVVLPDELVVVKGAPILPDIGEWKGEIEVQCRATANQRETVLVIDDDLEAQLRPTVILHPAMSQEEVIFTMYYGTPQSLDGPPRMPRFVHSLRRTGSKANVLMFVSEGAAGKVKSILAEYSVQVIPFKYSGNPNFWVSSLRFLLYRLAMERLPRSAKYFMISDVFDVVFQQDPFKFAKKKMAETGKSIIASVEESIMLKPGQADNGLNHKWVTQCFQSRREEVDNLLKGKNVLCSGVTFGIRNIIHNYIIDMDENMRMVSPLSNFSHERFQCAQHGRDQGVHIFVIYRNYANETHIEGSNVGKLMTLTGYTHFKFHMNMSQFLLNNIGEPFAVLHQVNRCSSVKGPDFAHFYEVMELPSINGSNAISMRLHAKPLGPPEKHLWEFVATNRTCLDVAWPKFMRDKIYSATNI